MHTKLWLKYLKGQDCHNNNCNDGVMITIKIIAGAIVHGT
jgi:hypothetical protein